ncbi:hypothetical protein D3C86_1448400 [compost metagenome]
MLLHELVFRLHQRARGFLRRGEDITDDLEHVGERRQREHQHHQPPDAGRDHELVRRMLQMVEEVAVEQVLALLLQAQRGVDLPARLARQDVAQEGHVGRRDLHVDHEIGMREREQDQQLFRTQQHGVQHELAGRAVDDRDRQRVGLVAVQHPADDHGGLVAEEQRR